MNAMFFISAYRQGKTWLFDDEQRGIKGEPFVAGASEKIQKHLDRKGITDTKDVPIVFSIEPFPGYDTVITCTEKCYPYIVTGWASLYSGESIPLLGESNSEPKITNPTSAWYVDEEGDKLWLCPAQIKFFGGVADVIYAKIG